eukprot:TRINITY_DN4553_c0_g4_i2.p1 TRINITY_DN4553_c0_g4~~TRINITY_DN4553_c0_g4_i2.p1  ORF type:complete len:105 (-),score=32.64 TRINITY_DN4553_c0_g4_i2:137-451(-)
MSTNNKGGGAENTGRRYDLETQKEFLHSKHPGTGNAATTGLEWAAAHHRATAASVLGRHPHAMYAALAEGVSLARMRRNLLDTIVDPLPNAEIELGPKNGNAEA